MLLSEALRPVGDGVLFATANVLTVPVINIIGTVLTVLLSDSASITVGRASDN